MKKDIQKKKRNKEDIDEKEAFISRAIFHLLNAVKVIAQQESSKLEKPNEIDAAIAKAISFVGEIVDVQSNKRGQLYTHDKFFKEIPTNKIIQDYVLKKYSKNVS